MYGVEAIEVVAKDGRIVNFIQSYDKIQKILTQIKSYTFLDNNFDLNTFAVEYYKAFVSY